MCRPVANQTRCAQTMVSDLIDRTNDFLDAGFIRPFERYVLYGLRRHIDPKPSANESYI